jgi:thioredoxin-related protein
MRKIFIILTTILTFLTACNQRQESENNKPVDSVTTKINDNQNKVFNINKLDSLQADLGLGLVSINFDDKTTLHFYSTPKDKKPLKTIQFFNDLTINSWNIRDLDKHKEWLNPEILWLDYSQFVFRCLTVQNNWFKVIVNNENGETLWLKKNELTTFKNWENYLTEMFGVARLPNHQQKIRVSPIENSDEIIYKGQDCFQVKSMKGDWIEIFTADYCDESYTDSKAKIKSGWIKWRQGNNLLIEYFTTS